MISNSVFPRHSKADLAVASHGDGCFIVDKTGKRYLDASGGAAVSCLGHSDDTVRKAITEQTEKLAFAHTSFFTSEPAEALADLLVAHAPEGISRAYFVSSGSEAVEAALKLAKQYYVEIGQPERHRIIARRQSYHGNTLGALAAGGNIWRRSFFETLLTDTSLIAPCYAYRDQQDGESEYDYGQRVANELETEILAVGAENVMAFLAEPIVGATAGALAPVSGYFTRIREICDKYGVLLILDEVMCGMGRTGSFFACEQEHISPDIVTIAKGLGAGYQPIGAALCTDTIYDAIAAGSGFFQHGHTYIGHPVACAASLAVMHRILDDDLCARVRQQGDLLNDRLHARFGQHPFVGDIRGRGLFRGIELVEDRTAKTPFARERNIAGKIKKQALEQGLICYPMQGTIDGKQGDHVLIAPPFIISDAEIDQLVDLVGTAIDLSVASSA